MSSIGQGPTQAEQTNSAGALNRGQVDYSDPSVRRGYSDQNSYSRTAAEEQIKSQVPKPRLDTPSAQAQSDAAHNEVLDDFQKSQQASASEYVKNEVKSQLKKGVSDGIANAEKQAAEQGAAQQSGKVAGKKKSTSTSTANTSGTDAETSAKADRSAKASEASSNASTLTSTGNADTTGSSRATVNTQTTAASQANATDEITVEQFDEFATAFEDVYVKIGAIEEAPPSLLREIQAEFSKFMRLAMNGDQPLDIDSATTMLTAIQTKLQDNRIKFDQETIKIRQVEYNQSFSESIGNIRDSIAKAKKAKTSGLIGKIFGWIAVAVMVIVTVIIAVVGAIFTGGALTAVAVSLMIAALAIVLTMQISSEAGSTWMMDIFGDSKEAKIGAMVFWTALIVALSIGGAVAGGFAGAAAGGGAAGANAASAGTSAGANAVSTGASTGATVTATATNTAATSSALTAKVTSGLNTLTRILQVVSGGAMIGDGSAQIATSVYNYAAENLRAEALEDRAFMLRLQQAIDDAVEAIGQVIEEMQAGYQVAANIIKANHETKSTLARNLRA